MIVGYKGRRLNGGRVGTRKDPAQSNIGERCCKHLCIAYASFREWPSVLFNPGVRVCDRLGVPDEEND
jgi:hypothetical protein